jgi:hypothetical protein
MAAVESILRDPPAPSRDTSTPAIRVKWMRDRHRLYARGLAVEDLLAGRDPDLPDKRRTEAFCACIGFGEQCKATGPEVIYAADAEWADAMCAAVNCVDTIRRWTWRMCAAGAPDETIIRKAEAACDQAGIWIPEEFMMPLLRGIDLAAKPRRRRHAR